MKPTETGFKAPILDFFPPAKGHINSITGLHFEEDGKVVLISYGRPDYSLQFRSGHIIRIDINDLGGLSIGFSDEVTYTGKDIRRQFLALKDPPTAYHEYIQFGHEYVARVKMKDGTIVSEHPQTPKHADPERIRL